MSYNCESLEPDSGERQEGRLQSWSSGETIKFESADAKNRYTAVANRIKNAVQLKKEPDRLPILTSPGHFPLEYAGVSFYDAMYDVDKLVYALRKFHDDFNPDTFCGSAIGSGHVLDLLDARQYNWAGHGLEKNTEYQFIEAERMVEEEYDELIHDPTGFHLNRFLPRLYGTMEPVADFPAIVDMRHMSSTAGMVLPFHKPKVREMMRKLMEAGEIAEKWMKTLGAFAGEMAGKGYTAFGGGTCEAPYDIIGDSLRGTRGISLDMLKIPDKLIEACDKYIPTQIKRALGGANASNNPFIFMPLHKGAHSFMSRDQFRKFYWPSLRKLLIGLINQGLVPFVFAESNYNSRLDIIMDLPPGRVIWLFEKIDLVQAKATVGQTCCIAGNLPNIIFKTGEPEDIKAMCQDIVDKAGTGGGLILSPSAGMQGAKAENVEALIEFNRS